MQSKAATVEQYLAELPEDRRAALGALRKVILKNLDKKGFKEGMQYGMIGYFVPHSVYPPGYHCDPKQPLPFAGIASQKNHMSVYMFSLYGDKATEGWFRGAWARSGKKKLDMGKCCVRFKNIDDVPLDVIGEAIKRVTVKEFIAYYESAIKPSDKRPSKKTSIATGNKAPAIKPASKSSKPSQKRKQRRPQRKLQRNHRDRNAGIGAVVCVVALRLLNFQNAGSIAGGVAGGIAGAFAGHTVARMPAG